MKKAYKVHIIILLLLAVLWLFTSCKTKTVYIPIETKKIEYRDKYIRDSIHYYDSIYLKEKGDSVILEKYKFIYRDKLIRDTVCKTDSINVLYPVEVPGTEANRLSSFQSFQIWCGRILLLLLLLYFGFKGIKRFI